MLLVQVTVGLSLKPENVLLRAGIARLLWQRVGHLAPDQLPTHEKHPSKTVTLTAKAQRESVFARSPWPNPSLHLQPGA